MAGDKAKIGDLYRAIGQEVALTVGNPDDTFFYVIAGDGGIDTSLFKDEGSQVRYFDVTKKMTDLLFDLWYAEDPDKRWCVMEYTVTGTKFQITFQFPDDFTPEALEDLVSDESRERVLNARYGTKPRVYPTPEEHDGWVLRQLRDQPD